jgi:hypothetical protein
LALSVSGGLLGFLSPADLLFPGVAWTAASGGMSLAALQRCGAIEHSVQRCGTEFEFVVSGAGLAVGATMLFVQVAVIILVEPQ